MADRLQDTRRNDSGDRARAKLAQARASFDDDAKNDHEALGHVLDLLREQIEPAPEASAPPEDYRVEPNRNRVEDTSMPRGVPSLHPPAAQQNDPQFGG